MIPLELAEAFLSWQLPTNTERNVTKQMILVTCKLQKYCFSSLQTYGDLILIIEIQNDKNDKGLEYQKDKGLESQAGFLVKQEAYHSLLLVVLFWFRDGDKGIISLELWPFLTVIES